MADIVIDYKDEVYVKIRGNSSVEREIYDEFKFTVDKSKFIRKNNKRNYKNWNGDIHMYNLRTKEIYCGLKQAVINFCNESGYTVEDNTPNNTITISDDDYDKFVKFLKLPQDRIPRDYQKDAFIHCVENSKALLVSPTSSGKSLLIYMLSRFYMTAEKDTKILIIVPGTILLDQMVSDFHSYGYTEDIHIVKGGKEKQADSHITVSTWHSLVDMDKEYYKQYTAVIFDEAHTCKAKSLTGIIGNLQGCRYRFGFTGTLQTDVVNILTLEGLFAPAKQFIKTHELMERKVIADLFINIICFDYDKQTRKYMKNKSYHEEIDFLISNEKRNKFIVKLEKNLSGNTLILCSRVDSHAKVLYDLFVAAGRKVYYIVGDTDDDTREKIRKKMETETNTVLIASYGTLSMGVSIVNLHNVIFATAYKTNIKTLQSIGRVLRKSNEKNDATLYDLADDFSHNGKNNFTLTHLYERVKIYDQEQFKYRTHRIALKSQYSPDS